MGRRPQNGIDAHFYWDYRVTVPEAANTIFKMLWLNSLQPRHSQLKRGFKCDTPDINYFKKEWK